MIINQEEDNEMFRTKNRYILLVAMFAIAISVCGANFAQAFYQSPQIPLFKTPLRGVGPGGIPVALPDATPAPVTGVTHYTIGIDEYTDQIATGLGPTTLRGYSPLLALGEGPSPRRHLGGIIVAEKGSPLQITFRNSLPAGQHIIPSDLTIMGANLGNNRTATHLHGGHVPWISDGGPHDWFDGGQGSSFLNNILNPGAAANEAEYYYPNDQSARFMWYHDHAFGITRINAYAGIATAYIIRDNFERSLRTLGLPDFIENGGREIPLVVQDKIFVGPNISAADPTWGLFSKVSAPGSLWYAHIYERNRWKMAGNAAGGSVKNPAPPDPSVIPEFFGDTMLVNGTTFPEATVEARRYRLRVLNACNARFLNLQLFIDDGSPNGITLNAAGNPANAPFVDGAQGLPAVLQIGTEGGFLPKPVKVPTNLPVNPVTLAGSMLLAPAERSDIIIDFSRYAGKNVILYNDAPAPFPMGDQRNDYFPGFNAKGNPVNGLTVPGNGPNTRVLMRFKVVAATSPDTPLAIKTSTDFTPGIDPLAMPPAVRTRRLTLNESYDNYGRLIQMLGTDVALTPSSGFGRPYMTMPTEETTDGATEIWEIYNTTGDTHPIHFHLVNVQLINRQPFQVQSLFANGTANFTGPAVLPASNEQGWKETVRMNPGEITRVIMRFALPKITGPGPLYPLITTGANSVKDIINGNPPPSPRTGGSEYVWHCHILEHEEHDMMRPLVVY